jgi:hypothetical protein
MILVALFSASARAPLRPSRNIECGMGCLPRFMLFHAAQLFAFVSGVTSRRLRFGASHGPVCVCPTFPMTRAKTVISCSLLFRLPFLTYYVVH